MRASADLGPGQPRLLADVGGTNARFALQTGAARFEHVEVLACGPHAGIGDAVRAYVASAALRGFAAASIPSARSSAASPATSR